MRPAATMTDQTMTSFGAVETLDNGREPVREVVGAVVDTGPSQKAAEDVPVQDIAVAETGGLTDLVCYTGMFPISELTVEAFDVIGWPTMMEHGAAEEFGPKLPSAGYSVSEAPGAVPVLDIDFVELLSGGTEFAPAPSLGHHVSEPGGYAFASHMLGAFDVPASAVDASVPDAQFQDGAPLPIGTLDDFGDMMRIGGWPGIAARSFDLSNDRDTGNFGTLRYNVTGFTDVEGIEDDDDGLSPARQQMVHEIFDYLGEVLDINFVSTSSTDAGVDIYFRDAGFITPGGFINPSSAGDYLLYDEGLLGSEYVNGHQYIDHVRVNMADGDATPGSSSWDTMMHEILHALGLWHPGPYNASPNLPPFQAITDTSQSNGNNNAFLNDSDQISIMSYINTSDVTLPDIPTNQGPIATPRQADFEALDVYYGINPDAFAGNTTYGFNDTIDDDDFPFLGRLDSGSFGATRGYTIVDSSGIDTLDFSGYNLSDQLIDLRSPTQFESELYPSSVGSGTQNMTIAIGTTIENAFGGGGDDTLRGNAIANELRGNDGDDSINAGGGTDTAFGGNGEDTIFGGGNSDSLRGGNNNDVLLGEDGNDTLRGESGDDTLKGGGGADRLFGGNGSDDLLGEGGNDILEDPGNDMDMLDGGLGNDRLVKTATGTQSAAAGTVYDGGDGTDTFEWAFGSILNYEVDLLAGELRYNGDARGQLVDIENVTVRNAAGVIGNNGANTLAAVGDYENTIDGRGGNDIIKGGGGDDALDGGSGNDTVVGEDGDDMLFGGIGNDSLDGGAGDDTLTDAGTLQSDTMRGGTGDDTLVKTGSTASASTVVIDGGADTDTFDWDRADIDDRFEVNLDTGFIVFEGGNRDRLLNIENVIVRNGADVTGNSDGNRLEAIGEFDNRIEGGAGNDTIKGGGGNDVLLGGGGVDIVSGEGGNDGITDNGVSNGSSYFGGSDNDTITKTGNTNGNASNGYDGGTDTDLFVWNTTTQDSRWVVDLEDEEITYNGQSRDTLQNFENVQVHNGVTVRGDDEDNRITAVGTYDNRFEGGGGNDIIKGSGGDDELLGGAGNDNLDGGNDNDSLLGGAGDDTLRGGSGDDTARGGDGDDLIKGGSGVDELYGDAGNDTIEGGITLGATHDGGAGDDVLIKTSSTSGVNDSWFGGAGIDELVYRSEIWVNRVVDLDAGRILFNGNNRDVLSSIENVTVENGVGVVGNRAANVIMGIGDFANRFEGGSGNDTISGGAGQDSIFGGLNDDSLTGGGAKDTIEGGAGNDTIHGSGGKDNLRGGDGDDEIYAGPGTSTDRARGDDGDDTIVGSDGDNRLFGNRGRDSIVGGGGDDTINGGGQSDTIDGGADDDRLTGGFGADNFIYRTSDLPNRDEILDFALGTDRLLLDDLGYTATVIGLGGQNLRLTWASGHELTLFGVSDAAALAADIVVL